ncbi:uncharacterized protein LOC111321874 [Stylophora pistillata]|uniref:uncharacterized protein LOC111321874 n=1 Tax=Stylophora pistillata TaxID=50429 RepID=UPI000C046127|nr:uncharacterized protein LOC111321874 [Stylophora pistillata]
MLWLKAINRGTEEARGKLWEPKSDYTYVCSANFLSGKKTNDKNHRDYVPSKFPHISHSGSPGKRKLERFERAQNKKRDIPNPVQQKSRPIEATSCSNMSEDVLTDLIEN